MRDSRIEKLACNLLNHSINLQKGEKILIEIIGTDAIPLGKELIKQSENINALPFFNIIDYQIMREMLKNATEEQIQVYAKHDLQRMNDMDAYIGVRASTNTAELNGISKRKMELYNKYYTLPVHFEERVKHTKWCILRYPNASMAQMSNMNTEEFEDFYFNVCTLDYEKMSKAMDALVNLMDKTKKVHIVGEGTDLTFSIEGILAEKYMGTFNIPDGEVATAPVKTSVNGYITYNTETRYNGVLFNNIKFEFENGRIVKATSNKTKQVAYPSCLSALLGITEPAVFGVNLRFVKPFIMSMIGGGVGGFLASNLNLRATGMSITGIPGTLLYLNDQLPLYLLVNVIAFAVAFALTWMFGFNKKMENQ